MELFSVARIQIATIERKQFGIFGSQVSISYTSAEMCGYDLYVGFSDGTLARFVIDKFTSSNHLYAELRSSIYISGTDVTKLKAVPSETTLLALSNKNLSFYNLDTLENKFFVKGVLDYCIDDIVSPLQMSIVKNRELQSCFLDHTLFYGKKIVLDQHIKVHFYFYFGFISGWKIHLFCRFKRI
jgi:hypothetical protein